MVLKVDEDNEFSRVFNKDTSANRVVVVYASCIVESCSFDFDSNIGQPSFLSLLDPADLMILSAELAEHFNNTSLYLKFRLSRHQRTKRHASKIAPHRDLHVFHFFRHFADFIEFLCKSLQLNFVELVRIAEVELRM